MADTGRPLAFDNVDEVDKQIERYFNDCFRVRQAMQSDSLDHPDDSCTDDAFPTMSGLAVALGVDRRTLYNYSKKEEFFPSIKNAKARIESALEQRLFYQHATGVIFNLKNNFDWKDKTEVDNKSSDGSMSPTKQAREMTDAELEAIAAEHDDKG